MTDLLSSKLRRLNLLSFVSLSALEKLFTIILVYLVAKTSDLETYNRLEYLFSISAVFYVIFELGISTYIFEELRRSRNQYIDSSNSHREHGAWIAGVLLMSVPFLYAFGLSEFIYLSVFIAFQVVQRIEQAIYRMLDRPSLPYIVNNILLIVQIALVWFAGMSLLALIIPRLLIIVFYLVSFFSWRKPSVLFRYLVDVVSFTWPFILNVFFITLLSNLLRIYGWQILDTESLTGLNIVLRFSSILLLLNTSITNYFRKSNYLLTGSIGMLRNTGLYAFILFCLAGLSFVFLSFWKSDINFMNNITNLQIAGMLAVTFLTAIASYSEVFLASSGKAVSVPITTLIGVLIAGIGLFLFVNSLNGLILVMLSSFLSISILRLYVIKTV